MEEEGAGVGTSSMRQHGRKRPRENDERLNDDENERPAVRIKTEVELGEFQEEDYENGPKTPLVIRDEDESIDEVEIPEGVIIKQEVDDVGRNAGEADDDMCDATGNAASSSRENLSSSSSRPAVIVKNEPMSDDEEGNQAQPTPGSSKTKAEVGTPKKATIAGFFAFGNKPQIKPKVPDSVNAEVKVKRATLPQKAHYNSHTADEESNYGGDDGSVKIKPIPLPVGKADDSEGSDEEAQNPGNNATSPRISRYFQRRNVYERYLFNRRKVDEKKLPVYEKKELILKALDTARVVIVEGFTGCGKTTQVPQYILDKCKMEDRVCNIVVTQPRKIAAMSVARRVCYERDWTLGSVVGYQVGLEKKADQNDTLLTFVTTGVLLQKLINQKSLKGFTHIIIDEVHERDLESDLLLLIIKKIMAADRAGKDSHVKLILMSATIETKKFSDYFLFRNENEEIRPHVVKIPYISRHKVDEHYLDDLLEMRTDLLDVIGSSLNRDKASIQEEVYNVAVSCIIALDKMEREANPDPRLRGNNTSYPRNRGAVLVFLPGLEEIRTLNRALDSANRLKVNDQDNPTRDANFYQWTILTLHSSVTSEDQELVFHPPANAFRKIILSTNIAESSVTVPDIAYVIDFCLTKSLCIDQATNFTTLRMTWAAKSQCTQRRGRTGRVGNGKVYRLVTKSFFHELELEIVPEMKRSNLETVILMCKKFDLDSPAGLLTHALDKPNLSGIERAISTLKELGALTIQMVDPKNGGLKYDTCDGDLTYLGEVMTLLPIPQQCTRLIMLGHAFGVMNEAVIIAAALTCKSPFLYGHREQLPAYMRKMKCAKKSFSDLFSLYYVYQEWIHKFAESGEICGRTRLQKERGWAQGALLNLNALREIKSTVDNLWERLKRKNIKDSYTVGSQTTTNTTTRADPNELSQNQGIFLKLAIAGAFYPNYFLRRRPDAKQFEREANRALNGNDLHRTIYFKGWPTGHDGRLYAKHIANHLSSGSSVPAIRFDGQKVLAIYDKTGEMIGPFCKAMYQALKKRQLRENVQFSMLGREYEQQELQEWERSVSQRQGNACPNRVTLPPINVNKVKVKVQHINNPSLFWVVFEKHYPRLQKMNQLIEEYKILLPSSKLVPNGFCLAPFQGSYFRAKIIRILGDGSKCLVNFVDYGNTEWVASSCLCDFTGTLSHNGVDTEGCMAVECRLSHLRPISMHAMHWATDAVKKMENFCRKAFRLEMEIYSVSNSVIAGDLLGYGEDGDVPYSLTGLLKTQDTDGKKQLGEATTEPYLSEENHRKRLRVDITDDGQRSAINYEQIGDELDLDFVAPPSGKHLRVPLELKGPWSPLEMTFQALVRSSNTKEVRVDNNSVNSVLLDHEPTTPKSRMLVAANVSVTDKSKAITARDSTVMAAVPGILSLVSMIFAPKVELRIDSAQTRYTGVLCGCGLTPIPRHNNLPVHPDNDMEIVFDTEIKDEDIDLINKIRYQLNLILGSDRSGSVNMAACHKQLGCNLIALLRKDRRRIDEEIWPQEEYVWNRIPSDNLNPNITDGLTFTPQDIFQPHYKVLINNVAIEVPEWEGDY